MLFFPHCIHSDRKNRSIPGKEYLVLSISEELYLLSLDEEKGNILPFVKGTIANGLSGTILAELVLQGKISSNEKHRVEIIDSTPTGDEILDEALQEIQSSEKPRKLSYWVSQLGAKPKKLRERFGERLAAKQILSQEDGRYFWRQPSIEDEQQAALSKFALKQALRAMVLSTETFDQRSMALLNVVSASELLKLIFTQDELPIANRRIHEIVVRAALENPTLQTIEEIEQAVSASIEDDNE
jgi:hypothetical protein